MSGNLALAGCVIGAVVSIAGAAILWNSWEQTRWTRTEGLVLESKVIRSNSRGPGERTPTQYWTLSVRYGYRVDGREYVSDDYSSIPPRSRAEGDAPPSRELENLAARYSPGSIVDVYTAPEEPQRALLEPQTKPVWQPLAVGIAILFAGAAAFVLQRGMPPPGP